MNIIRFGSFNRKTTNPILGIERSVMITLKKFMESGCDNFVVVGLCAGRHELPVSSYIYETIEDVTDFAAIESAASDFVLANCNVRERGVPINHTIDSDLIPRRGVFSAEKGIALVVTGLTQCTTAVIKACAYFGVPLRLFHFDRESGEYLEQLMF